MSKRPEDDDDGLYDHPDDDEDEDLEDESSNDPDDEDEPEEEIEDVEIVPLSGDLQATARDLSHQEARFLVTDFYLMQECRIRAGNQIESLKGKVANPILRHFFKQFKCLEGQMRGTLKIFADHDEMGIWAQSIRGIGEVLSSGLIAHIDMMKAPTVGAIWRFGGYDPSLKWLSRKKSNQEVAAVLSELTTLKGLEKLEEAMRILVKRYGFKLETIRYNATHSFNGKPKKLTRDSLCASLCRRPYNERLHTLLWKIGESFVKFQNKPDDIYGKLFVARKAFENERNERGELADQAAKKLRDFDISTSKKAYAIYAKGQLPPGHIHARAKRWTVKLFLSHWHHVAHWETFGRAPIKPYPLVRIPGHTHEIPVPNFNPLKYRDYPIKPYPVAGLRSSPSPE